MDRAQKAEAVAELNDTFSKVGVVVVTRNLGMTVAQSTDLRNRMRDAGASYKVSKNKLARIALDGTDYGSLSDMLTGPVGLASSTDPVASVPSWNGPYARRISLLTVSPTDSSTLRTSRFLPSVMETLIHRFAGELPSLSLALSSVASIGP